MPHLGPVLVSGFELMKCLAKNSGKGREVLKWDMETKERRGGSGLGFEIKPFLTLELFTLVEG